MGRADLPPSPPEKRSKVSIINRLGRIAKSNVSGFIHRIKRENPQETQEEKELKKRLEDAQRKKRHKEKKDVRLAKFYGQLELPFGADWDEVKKAYRRLLQKYHPDKHSHDTKRYKIATQVTQTLTHAYEELEKAYKGARSETPDSGDQVPEE
jgi:hypothetical protein